MFLKKEAPGQKPGTQHPLQTEGQSRPPQLARAEERKEKARAVEPAPKAKREARNSTAAPRQPSPCPSPNTYRSAPPGKSSSSDPPSQFEENTSDLGTMSSGASVPRSRPKKWSSGTSADLPAGAGPGLGPGGSAGAEVSSITSDYSTTSSITFLTGAESSALSPELPGGEEADDERSELISEGRPMETDSEGEFPVFAPQGGNSQSTPRSGQSLEKSEAPGEAEGGAGGKLDARRLFPTQRMIEGDTLSRRWSLRQKTDSESSVEAPPGGGEGGEAKLESSRLSRVLGVIKKGRSSSSVSSSERQEAAWRLKIAERLRFRLRTSADDTFAQKSRSPDARGKKKSIRRRHTMGGQRDFAELGMMGDWRGQGGVERSALDRLKPSCSSQDFSIRDWVSRDRCRGSLSGLEAAPRAVPEDDRQDTREASAERPHSSSTSNAQPLPGEHVNGGGPQSKNKGHLGVDPHPHKLSGAQVVRSRFYQYL